MSFSESKDGKLLLKSGLMKYSNSKYNDAIRDFREVILNPSNEDLYDVAYFWIARSYMSEGKLDKASANLEFFIKNFPNSHFYSESIYQKGYLLYLLHDYDNSIQVLYLYLKKYPNGTFAANSYFWIAESLFSLGNFDKAQTLYSFVIEHYPGSYKVEAARYKLSLINLKQHEEELLKLLRISHKQYLKVINDFQKREKTYEQAITEYQKKLFAASNNDTKQVFKKLNSELSKKNLEIADLKRKLSELKETADTSINKTEKVKLKPQEISPSQSLALLLNLKEEALNLKSFYLNWLAENAGE